jgi:AraC family transcriptional activator of pobA
MLEGDRRELGATALIIVPALIVHGFRFSPDADGYVLTVSTRFLDEAVEGDGELAAAFSGHGRCIREGLDPSLADVFQSVEQEFVRPAPGRRTAIKLNLQRILIAVARRECAEAAGEARVLSRDVKIVSRYRDLIEREFRHQPRLPSLARTLGVTTARLNTACREMTGRSALTLIHDRIIVEAKRNLLYTSLTVAEVARSVGFADPAYFNRFFSRRAGVAPGTFRSADPTPARNERLG